MPIAEVKIRSAPGAGNVRTVPDTFVVTGTLRGTDARHLRLSLSTTAVPQVAFDKPRVLSLKAPDTPGKKHVRWMAVVRMRNGKTDLAAGRYTLRVTPLKAGDAPHDAGAATLEIDLQRNNQLGKDRAGIDYPPPNHIVTGDELDFFYTTGESDVPVWNATITSQNPPATRNANYVYWVSELNYWVAEFLFLRDDPGPGRATMELDVQGSPKRDFTIG